MVWFKSFDCACWVVFCCCEYIIFEYILILLIRFVVLYKWTVFDGFSLSRLWFLFCLCLTELFFDVGLSGIVSIDFGYGFVLSFFELVIVYYRFGRVIFIAGFCAEDVLGCVFCHLIGVIF